jgi:acetyl esterase/lipase
MPLLLLACAVPALAQETVHDVIYAKQGGYALTMDVFKPAKPNGEGVIWIISGGWFSSHDQINAELAKPLTDKGITVFEVVHGSQPKFTIPEIIPMIKRSIRFIHANSATFGVDPNRLGLAGASAGGHLTLMVAGTEDNGDPNAKDPVDRQPDTIKAAVAYFPPTDFLNWGAPNKIPYDDPNLKIFMPAFGVTDTTPMETRLKIAHEVSPIEHIGSPYPATLLIHGDKDQLVPIQQSQEMDAALTKAGVTHDFMIVHGSGHDQVTMLAGLTRAVNWFVDHLQ